MSELKDKTIYQL